MKLTDEAPISTSTTETNFDLAELLAQVTVENLHDEINTGVAMGQETW